MLKAYIAGIYDDHLARGPSLKEVDPCLGNPAATTNIKGDRTGNQFSQIDATSLQRGRISMEEVCQEETTLVQLVSGSEAQTVHEGDDIELLPETLPPVLKPTRIRPPSFPVGNGLNNKEKGSLSHTADLENMIRVMIASPSHRELSTPLSIQKLASDKSISVGGLLATPAQTFPLNPLSSTFTPASPTPPQSWPTPSPPPDTIRMSTTSSSPPDRPHTRGQAYDQLSSWLTPLFAPLAQQIYTELRAARTHSDTGARHLPGAIRLRSPDNHGLTEEEEDQQAVGKAQALYQHRWFRERETKPEYEERQERKGGMWKVVCTATDGHGREWSVKRVLCVDTTQPSLLLSY